MWLTLSLPARAEEKVNEIDHAFSRLYNFDFQGAHIALNRRIASNPEDPIGYAVRSSAYLFSELDRLSILETEFFADNRRIPEKKKLSPDPLIMAQLFKAIDDAQSRGQIRLAANPDDQDALFAMCITAGGRTDSTA